MSLMRLIPSSGYLLGLTATPIRRDGQQPIIFMQCGPIRHTAAKPDTAAHDLAIVPRMLITRIDLPDEAGIQDVLRQVASDTGRTQAIATEIDNCFSQGRKIRVASPDCWGMLVIPLWNRLFVHDK